MVTDFPSLGVTAGPPPIPQETPIGRMNYGPVFRVTGGLVHANEVLISSCSQELLTSKREASSSIVIGVPRSLADELRGGKWINFLHSPCGYKSQDMTE